jgi:methylenetetrahydrofolate reductase (NADPH)
LRVALRGHCSGREDRRHGTLGVAYATLQAADLLARGAPGIHFYTLNRSSSTRAILSALKVSRPWRGGDAKPIEIKRALARSAMMNAASVS